MKVSVIIPVINEEKVLPQLLQYLNSYGGKFLFEIIVSDGGSNDNTCTVAAQYGAKVIAAPQKRRSVQMNFGAEHAQGDILYFLHADSCPPKDFTSLIVDQVQNGYASGCFQMRFDSNSWILRFSGWLTRFNSSWCRGGDQSMFVTKDKFFEAGKFREDYIIYEDNEILKRLRKIAKFMVIPRNIVTSARRYEVNGTLRLQMIFLMIHLRYRLLGQSQEKILKYYRKHVK